MNPRLFSKMLQIESYFNQIEVHKNHVCGFNKGLWNACYTHSTVLGPGVRAVSFQAIQLSPHPQGTYRCVNEFVNNQSRGEQNKAKGKVFQCTCQDKVCQDCNYMFHACIGMIVQKMFLQTVKPVSQYGILVIQE